MIRVLLAGVSTRAAAESAARAGFAVTAIDQFADLDQHASVQALSLPQRFTAHAAARAARRIECDAVAYGSNFENHPGAVRTLAAGRSLWGNAPAVLRRVRDPFLLAQTIGRRGFLVPAVLSGEPRTGNREPGTLNREPGTGNREPGVRWLVKPLASGGGHGVRLWRDTKGLPRGCYLQEFVAGTPGSVVFVAAGGRSVPIGITRQLVGERAFGATGYRYCGNILEAADDADHGDGTALVDRACALAAVVTEEFGLVGVNVIDFVARDAVPYAIEVNPRWAASMELVEQAYGLSVFGAHAAACTAGTLPAFDLARARRGARHVGKAVVFARRPVVIGDTRAWLTATAAHPAVPALPVLPAPPAPPAPPALEVAWIRDVPHPGEEIAAGRPVCTVFASGHDANSCRAALERCAERVYADLDAWTQDPRRPGHIEALA